MDNRERIEEVYRLYEQKMYRIAFSILGDVTDAEDAVQDAFLKLVRLVRKLEDPASDRTKRYVLRAIQSTSIDIYRKNKELLLTPEETSYRKIAEEVKRQMEETLPHLESASCFQEWNAYASVEMENQRVRRQQYFDKIHPPVGWYC